MMRGGEDGRRVVPTSRVFEALAQSGGGVGARACACVRSCVCLQESPPINGTDQRQRNGVVEEACRRAGGRGEGRNFCLRGLDQIFAYGGKHQWRQTRTYAGRARRARHRSTYSEHAGVREEATMRLWSARSERRDVQGVVNAAKERLARRARGSASLRQRFFLLLHCNGATTQLRFTASDPVMLRE